ncbi:efflux transporter outer membrane subunit [uncultured Desulfuromonas sp.]|uniref:efflux transporter outer membrane subunit n=1 Tax=uncultured Desulfuromonas sp. TaxID=181013 RepID=UPI0026021BE5|nr:efflux transporter outer membrane subunit [uncultured Desulfuromonas sp.]
MYKQVRHIIALTLFSLLLAGCTLGPDYLRPEVDTPLAWKEGAPWKEAAPMDGAPKGSWWEIYGDPVLNGLEEEAAAANQDLRAAAARVDQARALARIDEADLLPRVDLNPAAGRARTPGDFAFGGKGVTGDSYSVPFDLSYEIDLWGRVRRSAEASRADAGASLADYRNVLLVLQAEVAGNYFALRSLDAEIALLERTVGLRRENLELVASLFEHGQVGRLDVARAETELATTEAEALGVQKRRAELEHALAVLLGRAAAGFALSPAPLDLTPPAVAPGLPSSLLERRPDVGAAERQMAAASARIGIARTAFFPAIRLTGSAGYASTEASGLFDWDSRSWALGPAVSLPIFEAGRNRANLNRARAAYEEAVAIYRRQVLVAFAEVEDALSGLRVLAAQADAQGRAVGAAREAAEISDKRYQAGFVSYLEVVDSQRTSLQSERQAVQILGQRLQASVSLIKALGGGWNMEPGQAG